MSNRLISTTAFALAGCFMFNAAYAQNVPISDNADLGLLKFDNTHSDEYVWDAIGELSGMRPEESAGRVELAREVLAQLDGMLPQYGQKSTPQVRPEVPLWFTDGYERFNPAVVAHSRYFDALLSGQYEPDAAYAGLYSAYCAYDAEWFTLSRHSAYRAWLSAVLLDYAGEWEGLRVAGQDNLHATYVAPLQTKDEPYREIDNWIKRLTADEEVFLKPTVRNALVQELLGRAGLEVDPRYMMEQGYLNTDAQTLGISEREFYLLAALTLEFFNELAVVSPENVQKNHFRDYFIRQFYLINK